MHQTSRLKRALVILGIVSLGEMGISTSVLANDAVILLNQMNDALHTLEYKGKLVYLKDGEAYNLSIEHIVEDNGTEKEVVKMLDQNGDDYVRETTAFSLSALPKITPQMQQIYSFDIGGMGKVAGRPCRIVVARPKDRKRYLQKYCIDLDRSVVLKYSLINQHHQPVERFMFTDFEVLKSSDEHLPEGSREKARPANTAALTGNAVAATDIANAKTALTAPDNALSSALLPLTDMDDDSTDQSQPADSLASRSAGDGLPQADHVQGAPDQYSEWFFDPLPAGFRIISSDKVKNASGEDEQIVISDGLSSVSVFFSADSKPVKSYKPIRSGALNILTRRYKGYTVTLVGEVPESTLDDIYKGIKRADIKK